MSTRYERLKHAYCEIHPLNGNAFTGMTRNCQCGEAIRIANPEQAITVNCRCGRQMVHEPKMNRKAAKPQWAGKPIDKNGKPVDSFWRPNHQVPVGYKSRLQELQEAFAMSVKGA